MRPVIEMICRQCFEHPHEGGVLLLPSLNEELSIAKLSAKRSCRHRRTFLCALKSGLQMAAGERRHPAPRVSCSVNLFRVLRLAVAKRPVLFADFNQTNEHVLAAQA